MNIPNASRYVGILCTVYARNNYLEFELELVATSNYVGTHSYILPTLDLLAHAIHGGAQGSIYFNLEGHKIVKRLDSEKRLD